MIVVADTGFISSLLKINKAELILKLFEIDSIIVPVQVVKELEKSYFFKKVAHLFSHNKNSRFWIQIINIEIKKDSKFGQGETAAIKIAKEKNAVLLIDDKKALKEAEKLGIICLDLAGFLFACKQTELINTNHLKSIIDDLKKKDHYIFSKEILELLLS